MASDSTGSKKVKLREVMVAVLQLDDGDDARTVMVSVETLGELIELGLKVCREREALHEFTGDAFAERPKYRSFLQAVEQMHDGMVRAGVLADLADEDDEEDGDETKNQNNHE